MPKTQATEPIQPQSVRSHQGNGINGAEPISEAHPWAQIIGSMKDDPTWDEVMAIIAENRRVQDEELNAEQEKNDVTLTDVPA